MILVNYKYGCVSWWPSPVKRFKAQHNILYQTTTYILIFTFNKLNYIRVFEQDCTEILVHNIVQYAIHLPGNDV